MPTSRPGRRVALPRHLAPVVLLVAGLLALAPVLPETSDATVGNDDYPNRLQSAAQDALVDPWLFYNRECTSFVAWRLNNHADVPFHNYYLGVHWGDASHWKSAANQVGIPVDNTPRVGSVAWWAAGSPGSSRGHVAWVMGRTRSSITIEEYNYLSAGHYDQRTISTSSSMWPSGFIHINRRSLSNTKAPSIRGTPRVNARLTARPGSWNLSGASFSYRWLADGKVIVGATNRSFAPRPRQLGKRLQVRVTAQVGSGPSVKATSPNTAPVALGIYRPTGNPTISGTAQVGEPMSATRGTWAPAGATFSYQWLANGEPVEGATGRSFAPRAEQLGQHVRVQVTARGRGMEPALALSPNSVPVIPGELIPTDQPTITGTPRVDNQLSATRGTWSRRASYSYQWSAGGRPVRGADTRTFSPSARQLGKRISVAVTATRPGYRTAKSRSTDTGAVAPATFATTGPPMITGTAQVDEPLKASAGEWSPSGSASYQWYVGGEPVAGATTTTFTPRISDVRKQVTVTVTMRRAGYVTTSSSSAATDGVLPGTFQNSSDPKITGTPRVGLTLTATPGGWSPKPSLSYQWLADGTPIPGATATTFTPTGAQLAKHISVAVTARHAGYLTALVESAATAKVAPGHITGVKAPVISGKPYVGSTLTATSGTWSIKPTSIDYQWYADGVAITGATGASYTPTAAVLDHTLTVRVTVSSDGYRPATQRSTATQPVVRGRATFSSDPTLSGVALVGRVLTATPGKFSPSSAEPSYTWLRSGSPIAGASGPKYELTPADVGERISVEVTLTAPHWDSGSARTNRLPVVKAVPELTVTSRVRGDRVTLWFAVRAPGVADPAGKVVVTQHGVAVGRVAIVNGHGRLDLSDVRSGVRRYRFAYTGTLQDPRFGHLDVTVP